MEYMYYLLMIFIIICMSYIRSDITKSTKKIEKIVIEQCNK